MATRLKTMAGSIATLTVAGVLAVNTIGGFEGLRLNSYPDIVGVWTACYGETKGIKPGMRFSKKECDNMLVESLIEHEGRMRACMKNPDSLPNGVYIANLSLAYNVGTGAFCKSTLLKLQNAGKIKESCEEFMKWNKAGGREIKGLTDRRAKERAMCLKGVAGA